MRNFFLILIALVLLTLNVQNVYATSLFNIVGGGSEFGFEYRHDDLNWNIAYNFNGETPNIYSELTWENLEIIQFGGAQWFEIGELPLLDSNTLVKLNLSCGSIIDGNYQDSDYATDNRGNEWSRSIGDADNGFVADLSGGFGPIVKFEKLVGVSITPLIGYAFNMQDLSMTNGVQRVSISGDKPGTPVSLPAVGSNLSGLDSSYTAYWYGPWLGVSIDYKINKKFNLTTGCEYHWVEYFAEANWNLRSDFDHPNSFEHETVGTGIVWNITGEYLFSEKWSWLLGANIQSWETAAGSVRTFNADGSVGKTRLNEVNWSSYAFKTGIVYRF